MSYTIPFRRVVGVTSSIPRRAFNSQSRLGISANLDSDTISKITQKEREITGSDGPVKGGPTAEAQKHAGQPINSQSLRDIAKGEKKITGEDGPVRGGPTSVAQSHVGKVSCAAHCLLVLSLIQNDFYIGRSRSEQGGQPSGRTSGFAHDL